MIFPGLDGSFCGIASVAVRGDALEIEVIFYKGLAEFVGALVVENVCFRCVAIVFEDFVHFIPT